MEYTEENVRLAYTRHPTTPPRQHHIWKFRGKIPDKYFDDAQLVRPLVRALEPVERTRQQRLRQVLQSKKINTVALWKLSALPQQDWMRTGFASGKVQLTEMERIQLQTSVQQLRTLITNTLRQEAGSERLRNKALLQVAWDPRIVKRIAFGKELGDILSPSRRRDVDDFLPAQLARLRECLSLLVVEITPL